MSSHIEKLIADVEYAGHEYAAAAVDATDAGHEHGDMSPQAREAYGHYVNWRQIFGDACNTLRTSLGVPESRPDVEAYVSPTEGI